MSLRLIFMGSPAFAVPALEAVIDAGHEVARVYAQPPRPAGRGKKPRPTPVHARAEELGLAVNTPVSLRDPGEQAAFAALEADLAVVAAYGLLLPKPILEATRHGCLNIHPSLLPRWRGAAPIQRAVMAGDARTGVCIMRMEEGLDTGPVLLRAETEILPAETSGELHDRLAEMGARLLVEALAGIKAGALRAEPQSENGVVYAPKIDKAEARIDWTRPASEVAAHVNGLSPFPGAWCEVDGARLKLLKSETVEGAGAPGTVLDADGRIACGAGAIRLLRVQREGRPPMAAEAFLRGFALEPGSVMS